MKRKIKIVSFSIVWIISALIFFNTVFISKKSHISTGRIILKRDNKSLTTPLREKNTNYFETIKMAGSTITSILSFIGLLSSITGITIKDLLKRKGVKK